MTGTKFSKPQWQLTIALKSLIKYLNMPRAIHWLDGKITRFRGGGKHVLAVIFPVPGFFPEAAIQHLRGANLLITVVAKHAAHVLLHHLPNCPAVGVPEHHTWRIFLSMEQILMLADFTVVALFGFFKAVQIGIQRLLVSPRCTVNTLQHFIFGITAPVGTGHLHQLERLDLTGRWYMRTTAKISKTALAV